MNRSSGRLTTRRLAFVASVAAATAGLGANSAGAAVTIGETFIPNQACDVVTFIQVSSPPASAQYSAPSAGVITSWSYRTAGNVPAFLRLHVARNAGGSNFTTVGRSEREVPLVNQLNTYATRIAVQPGDVIGFFYSGAGAFTCVSAPAGYTYAYFNGDPAPGLTVAFSITSSVQLPISARLEPDADNDGFGDETQDLCPSDADTVQACRTPPDTTPPDTTITKQPKKKEKKKGTSFEFSSPEAGSTFRCSLNGDPFAACTSPHSVKAKKGLNVFTVFAKDAAGNVDDSPATYSWTFKKKKKK